MTDSEESAVENMQDVEAGEDFTGCDVVTEENVEAGSDAEQAEDEVPSGKGYAARMWPKPVRTEKDWENIAYLAKLRECEDEEKPEGLPLACIVRVLEASDVPMANDKYAMVTVYGPDDRVWKMCVNRGTAKAGDEMLFVSEDAALPIDERWRDPLICPTKLRVYKYGQGIKVRRMLLIVRRNIYRINNGALFPIDDFAKDLRNARIGEDCSAILNIESAEELKMRQNAKKPKLVLPDTPIVVPPALKKKMKRRNTKASYNFLDAVRWMRKKVSK